MSLMIVTNKRKSAMKADRSSFQVSGKFLENDRNSVIFRIIKDENRLLIMLLLCLRIKKPGAGTPGLLFQKIYACKRV